MLCFLPVAIIHFKTGYKVDAAHFWPGAVATLGCLQPRRRLDVFGFNWNTEKSYFMHKMGAEGAIMARLLAASGASVTVHPTACGGLYSCERACDGPKYRLAADGDDSECRKKVRMAQRPYVAPMPAPTVSHICF